MTTAERRAAILQQLAHAGAPIAARTLATHYGVSRQVIVQDLAVIRASHPGIISTARGYVLEQPDQPAGCTREFKVRHTPDRTGQELNLIVDCGGRVKNISISHRVYGRITAEMDIRSRQDVREFLQSFEDSSSTVLSTATDGYHYHLVEAATPDRLSLIEKELKENSYPGRGIILGKSEDGTKAVAAYFIMGRSENSRNRVFVEEGEGIRTQAFDPSKLSDPSLIIYAPVRVLGNDTIVTNGDQTDTVYDLMSQGKTFEESLRTREFEPDGPNYTPRISGIMHIENGTFDYAMSILKSNNGNPAACNRYTFDYRNPVAGEGRFIHTYMKDANPLPSFEGEPTWVRISGDIDTFTNMIWNNLNEDNKVSLFVRFIDIETGKYETRIINKNK